MNTQQFLSSSLVILSFWLVITSDEAECKLTGNTRMVAKKVSAKKLLDKLLEPYNTLARPVRKPGDVLLISIGVSLLNIRHVAWIDGIMNTNLWLSLEWVDANLRWKIQQTEGVQELNIPIHRIWKPDISLLNSYRDLDTTYQTQAVVKANGSLRYVAPGQFISTCDTDITNYPFDQHECVLKFGSWNMHSEKILLTLNNEMGGDLSNFEVTHPDWELLGMPASVHEVYHPCCKQPFSEARFTIRVKRRGSDTFLSNSALLLLGAICILSAMLFLPIGSVQRNNLGVVTLLGLLYLCVSHWQSSGGKYTHIALYFQISTFLTFTAIFGNLFVSHLYNMDPDHQPWNWVDKFVCNRLSYYICVSRPSTVLQPLTHHIPTDINQIKVDQIISDMRGLVKSISGKEDATVNINDWQFAGLVLDRLLFVLYSVFYMICFIVYFTHFWFIK